MKAVRIPLFVLCMTAAGVVFAQAASPDAVRRLPVPVYRDKMKAAWIGQMAGVGWGGPTEFGWMGKMVPEDKLPVWTPDTVNQFEQDDIYVEMTFVRTLEQYGPDVSIRQAGIDFANSGYELWHANKAGRDNLREGIAPPDSGHPQFNKHADDIDYQIEADFSGMIAPGMLNMVIQIGECFGRLMNYGDGLYAGQFVGALYAEAFFETNVEKLVETALKSIPEQSQYHECIADVVQWHRENPNDWRVVWQKIEDKYDHNGGYRKASCSKAEDPFNIDAKINGAYAVMGLLYGGGDIEKTIRVATSCGQDSDCNPATAAGVLFAALGTDKIPAQYTKALDTSKVFSHTEYNFARLLEACEKLARQYVVRAGGKIEKDAQGVETFVIPVTPTKPSAFEQSWAPGPVANAKFTPEEMAKITGGKAEKK